MKIDVRTYWIYEAFFYIQIVYWYLKTFIIMANIDLKFLCNSQDGDYIKVTLEDEGEFINIRGESAGCNFYIELDKSTAIKFAKTLRTEINKIQD